MVPQRCLSEAFVIIWSPLPPENTHVLVSPLFRRLDKVEAIFPQRLPSVALCAGP